MCKNLWIKFKKLLTDKKGLVVKKKIRINLNAIKRKMETKCGIFIKCNMA